MKEYSEYPLPALGAEMPDKTVFAGWNPHNDHFIYALPLPPRDGERQASLLPPRAKGLMRLFNTAARRLRALNDAKVGGHDDWRLPTEQEKEWLKKNAVAIEREKRGASLVYPSAFSNFTGQAMYYDPEDPSHNHIDGLSPEERSRENRESLQLPDIRAIRSAPRPPEYAEKKKVYKTRRVASEEVREFADWLESRKTARRPQRKP